MILPVPTPMPAGHRDRDRRQTSVAVGDCVELVHDPDGHEADDHEDSTQGFRVPSHVHTAGKIVDHLGQPTGNTAAAATTTSSEDRDGTPMFRRPPLLDELDSITVPLLTGVKAVDMLTPLGRGQCMLFTGGPDSALTTLGLTVTSAQRRLAPTVRCVYAAVGCSATGIGDIAALLGGSRVAGGTASLDPSVTLVTAGEASSTAER